MLRPIGSGTSNSSSIALTTPLLPHLLGLYHRSLSLSSLPAGSGTAQTMSIALNNQCRS
ncbi:hypothetical protein [Microcoleus sp. Pol17C2]|uniref:hypothetical protein n=1 Tax=Microcoleus sp. Pol17C2 TaxID=3055403 RepID=UPI002FCFE1F9